MSPYQSTVWERKGDRQIQPEAFETQQKEMGNKEERVSESNREEIDKGAYKRGEG